MTGSGKKRLLLFLVALCFIFCGVWRGEAAMVFQKAIRVCMECIGLG
ncbi:CD1871A family CXXC motif-containing protein [Anaerovibrio sp. RM50]|nr:CD1871A family CXXC motif-containing protein [Anaerovibrio sp. RM50]